MNYSVSNISAFFLFLTSLFVLIFTNHDLEYIFFDTKLYIFFSYALCAIVIINYIFRIKSFRYIPILPLSCFYFISCLQHTM